MPLPGRTGRPRAVAACCATISPPPSPPPVSARRPVPGETYWPGAITSRRPRVPVNRSRRQTSCAGGACRSIGPAGRDRPWRAISAVPARQVLPERAVAQRGREARHGIAPERHLAEEAPGTRLAARWNVERVAGRQTILVIQGIDGG